MTGTGAQCLNRGMGKPGVKGWKGLYVKERDRHSDREIVHRGGVGLFSLHHGFITWGFDPVLAVSFR